MSNNLATNAKEFPLLLDKMKSQIALALPKHMDVDRMLRVSLTCFRTTPKLAECDPMSVIAAIVQSAQLGLEPGLMGQAYLIPFKRSFKRGNDWHSVMECQFMPGYRGLISLARRGGDVTSINAEIVYDKDFFEIELGVNPSLKHKPKIDGERGEPICVYAVAQFKEGSYQFGWMTIEEVEKIRLRNEKKNSKNKEADYKKETPWDTDYEEMAKKTMIRRICKTLPMSVELAKAIAVTDAVDQGKRAVIEGDFVNVIEPEAEPLTETEGDGDTTGAGADAGTSKKEEAKPQYTEDEFKSRLPMWEKLIKEGKKTADEVVAMAETRSTFSTDQKQILKDIKVEQAA
ncbi:MAG: recombinase RecT [Pseudomonadota bacterium]